MGDMILDFQETPSKFSKTGVAFKAKIRCDVCLEEFEEKGSRARDRLQQEYHCCSRKCYATSRKKGGFAYEKSKQTYLQKYGVEHSTQLPDVQEKYRQTMIERYGVENALALPGIRERSVVAAHSDEARNKRVKTNLERYGVDNPAKSERVKKKILSQRQQTNLERYGVKNPYQVDEFYEKGRQTCIDKFGTRHPIRTKEVQKKRRQTCKRVHGVNNVMQSPDIARSSLENRSAGLISNAERSFGDWLVENLNDHQIESQVIVDRWSIDFCIDGKIYVNFDGSYWHGHNHTIEELKNSDKPQLRGIYRCIIKDHFQDEWFRRQGLTLVRVTDIEHRDEPAVVLKRIKDAIWSKT